MLYVIAGRTVTPFHGDESIYTAMSVDYGYLFIEQDLSKVLYSETPHNPVLQSYRITDAVLMRYFIGMAWHLQGFGVEDMNAPWWWEQSFEFNVENNYHPGDDLLLAARIPAVLFTAGAVLLLFLIGLNLQGRITAYIASLYFGLNPAVLVNGRRAAKEGPHLFFELFVLLVAIMMLRALHARANGQRHLPLWAYGITLGASSGLAIASKHTNVLVVATVFAALFFYAAFKMRHQFRDVFVRLLLAGSLCIGTFIAVSPAYWNNPIERALMAAEIRADVLSGQVNNFDNSYQGNLALKLQGFWQLVFAGGAPMYYEAEEWGGYIGNQIIHYETTPFTGLSLPGTGVPLFALMLIGYAVLYGLLKPTQIDPIAQWVLGFWGVVVLIYAVLLIPLGWQRYYLPFYPMLGITAALGVTWVVQLYRRDAQVNSSVYRGGSARVTNH